MRARFWQHWSIRRQLLLMIVGPVVAMCLALLWYSYQSRQAEVRAELAERGQLLARVLADSSEFALISGQLGKLKQTAADVVQSDTAIYRLTLLDAKHRELLRVDGAGRGSPEPRYYERPVVKRLVWVNTQAADGTLYFGSAGSGKPSMTVETMGFVQVRMSPDALLRKQEERFWLELLVAGAVLLACAALAWRLADGFDASLRASMQALEEADAEKRRLIRKVNTAVEEERRSIALEIHDELNATLIAARLESQRIAALAREAQPPKVAQEIAQRAGTVVQLALGLYNSGRSLVRRLRPEMLEMLGLQGAVDEMVRQYDQSHPDCRFMFRSSGEFAALDAEAAISAYRIVQEALSNIVKHAKARHAEVALARQGDTLHIDIADDGAGFDTARGGAGIGIVGMRERVHALGGSLQIESGHEGTRIAIRLRIKEG